ncbi:type II secretion system protein [Mucisphaera calidilacus]|uniref:Type II secretion system protein G n=1 Tax=Mucisphaera calidilacus TaxID=2527982 RepID=A0A518BU64_9BACT|nr:prepilin-type N-terminal cleavage/methylation domain-containing protein [Mucisphaera calidilacus]QDU70484.1 hypothetical protein Pan265_03120 [Mucisphaera calidilacus]
MRTIRHSLAFTLIELLVVISILALLIGLLLPALRSARETARTAVCLANMKSYGIGLDVYALEHNGWLAGPYTSGNGNRRWGQADVFNWAEETASNAPSYAYDWVSPSMSDIMGGLPRQRAKRLVAILNSELSCPTNDIEYGSSNGLSGEDVYSDPYGPSDAVIRNANGGELPQLVDYSLILGFHETRYGPYEADSGYQPNLNQIGRPSAKASVQEGADPRFLDVRGFDLGSEYNDYSGGPLCHRGAASYTDGSTFRKSEPGKVTDLAQTYAFRHPNKTINTLFFDGHVDNQDSYAAIGGFAQYFPEAFVPYEFYRDLYGLD